MAAATYAVPLCSTQYLFNRPNSLVICFYLYHSKQQNHQYATFLLCEIFPPALHAIWHASLVYCQLGFLQICPQLTIKAHLRLITTRCPLSHFTHIWKRSTQLAEKSGQRKQRSAKHASTQPTTFTCSKCGRDCHAIVGLSSATETAMPEWGYQVRQRLPSHSGAIKCGRDCHAIVGLSSAAETAMPEWGYQVRQRLPCYSGAIKCDRDCHARVGLPSAAETAMPEWGYQVRQRLPCHSGAIKCDRDCHSREGPLSATETAMPEWGY